MRNSALKIQSRRRHCAAFTLAEVLISLALLGMMLGGIITAYLAAAQRAEWASASAAAHRLAVMKMEQLKAAPWDWVYNGGDGIAVMEIQSLDMPRTVAQGEGEGEVIVRAFSRTHATNAFILELEVQVDPAETFSHLRNFTPPPLRTYRASD
jgi:hypothetical protein